MKNKKIKTKGFSLIELIVVMTIIMVISVVGIVTFTGTNKKARDSKRMADLEKVRIALELYKQENNSYPLDARTSLVSNFLQEWPTDPKNYNYVYTRVSIYSYTLDAYLESGGANVGSAGACGGSPAVTCNYRVRNP